MPSLTDLIMSLLVSRLCRLLLLIRVTHLRDSQCVALFNVLGIEEYQDSDSQLSASLRARLHQYCIDNCLLCYRTDVADTARIVVPQDEDLKYLILFEAHDTSLSGQLGQEKTYGSVIQH